MKDTTTHSPDNEIPTRLILKKMTIPSAVDDVDESEPSDIAWVPVWKYLPKLEISVA